MTYYVKTDDEEFTKELKSELEKKGYQEGHIPTNFVFLSGKYAYNKNLFNMKQSLLTNIVKPIKITNKLELHKLFQNEKFIKSFIIIQKTIPKFTGLKILKPVNGFQGLGITIVRTSEEVDKWIKNFKHKDIRDGDWLLQDYILNPALKDGHKFHLRVLVLVIDDKVYMYNKSPYYLAKTKYKLEDFHNKDIHDTHYNSNFNYFYPDVLPDEWKRKSDISKVLSTVFKGIKLKPDWNSKNSFCMYGADIMFEGHKPILLEVNDRIGLKAVKLVVSDMLDTLEGKKSNFIPI